MISKLLKITIYAFIFCIVAGTSAYFTLSIIIKGEETVVIPDLVGKDIVYALEVLTDLGVNIKVKGSEYSIDIPKNHVVSQDPGPGAMIKEGRDVRIVFSKGEEQILMPNLKGLSVQQATIILDENDLNVNMISKVSHESVDENMIIAQSPAPGTRVKRKMNADLLISTGPLPVFYSQPDFTGIRLEDAVLLIEQKGLVPGNISSIYKPDVPQNVVVRQNPLAGYAVKMKSRVDLVINRTPDAKHKSIDLKSINGVKLFRHKTGFGFLKKHIRIDLNIYNQSYCILDQFVKPNEELWVSVPNQTEATLLLYENDELVITEMYDSW
ncbi:MAG: PASTA domain-containing protein [Proteobacteria bacterium]|nr:PASTA domain-containing protein [Pseudomonadota bacterium]